MVASTQPAVKSATQTRREKRAAARARLHERVAAACTFDFGPLPSTYTESAAETAYRAELAEEAAWLAEHPISDEEREKLEADAEMDFDAHAERLEGSRGRWSAC